MIQRLNKEYTFTMYKWQLMGISALILFSIFIVTVSVFKGIIGMNDSRLLEAKRMEVQAKHNEVAAWKEAHKSDSTTKVVILREIKFRDSVTSNRVINEVRENRQTFKEWISDPIIRKSFEVLHKTDKYRKK